MGIIQHLGIGEKLKCCPPVCSHMPEWPKEIGDHTVTEDWECRDCGASYTCFTQFRQNDCQ